MDQSPAGGYCILTPSASWCPASNFSPSSFDFKLKDVRVPTGPPTNRILASVLGTGQNPFSV